MQTNKTINLLVTQIQSNSIRQFSSTKLNFNTIIESTTPSTSPIPPPIASTSTSITSLIPSESAPIKDSLEITTESELEEDNNNNKNNFNNGKKLPSKGYRAWLNSEGQRFRNPLQGKTNWLGETPFPLNPTFNPLPPLADVLKTQIYKAYLSNIKIPDAQDALVIRAISNKFGIEMMRVRAVIRLKELESSWSKEGKPLQTNLLKGMESCLGVKIPGPNFKGIESPDGIEVNRAGSKTIFEMIDLEGDDPSVFLPLLATPLPTSSSSSSTSTPKKPTTLRKITLIPSKNSARAGTIFKDVSKTWEGKIMKGTYENGRIKKVREERARAEKESKGSE